MAQAQILATYPDSLVDLAQSVLIPFLARGSMREGDLLLAGMTPAQRSEPLVFYWRKAWFRTAGNWAEAAKGDREHRYIDAFGESHWSQDVTAAFTLLANGDQAAARTLAEQAIVAGKEEIAQKASATGWVTLSNAYALVGDIAEALRCAQTAKDMIPEVEGCGVRPAGEPELWADSGLGR